ncbi:hypothetical protein IT408_01820 [Candidatus Uhrbacteria bacterium]|nr:hypothetical protein [Candidatus Uhrbacteria bacterium]
MNNPELQNDHVSLTAMETKFALARKMISNLREDLSNLERLLSSASETDGSMEELVTRVSHRPDQDTFGPNEGKIVEGVFDGEHMVGSDGNQYVVPPNYASKSKLVEGDILKLTIQPNGTFLFKQIGPIERQRVMGIIVRDEMTNDLRIIANNKKYHVLTAAVSYHRGDTGDEAVILIPKAAPSKWAAVENIIKRT